MVTVLITSFLLLAVISFAIYRWQRIASGDNANRSLPPQPEFDGLFADSIAAEQTRLNAAQIETEREEKQEELLARAAQGEKSALTDAHQTGDSEHYDEVLNLLVKRVENDRQLLALTSFISRNDGLPVNSTLAKAFRETWKSSPDRNTTAKMLHVVALSGDAELYQESIELASEYWLENRLQDITAEELVSLIESEFWLIPSNARTSGAGFLLKRKLAKIRREIAAATRE